MVIDSGIGQVFKRQAGELTQGLVRLGPTCLDVVQQPLYLVLVHLEEFYHGAGPTAYKRAIVS
jgi:hypothetical protein